VASVVIPEFPVFARLSPDVQESIVAFGRGFEPYSEFNFTKLFCWDVTNRVAVSCLNSNLVVRHPDYNAGGFFYSFLGVDEPETTTSTLIDYAGAEMNEPLGLVPAIVAERLVGSTEFLVKEDFNNDDYVLSIESLADLSGPKHCAKRRRIINKFLRENPPCYVDVLELDRPQHRREIMIAFDKWARTKSVTGAENIAGEREALRRLLSHSSLFANTVLTGLRINTELIAFVISEVLDEGYVIGHFEKADRSMPGAFQYLMFNHCIALRDRRLKYLNACQDLGIEGLRHNKLSYDPVKFLKKYTIGLKQPAARR
jgi:hypothetical protein